MRLLLDGGKTVEFHGPGDITRETTDAIVNAANSSLLGGGGVDGAIHRVGGPDILEDCRRIVAQIGHLPAGQAVITRGGRLAARHVIHTVGPIYREGSGSEALTLASCYRESIQIADRHALRSLAFPSVSTGVYGYPVREAAGIAVAAAVNALESASHVRSVRFVLFDAATLKAYMGAATALHNPKTRSHYTTEKNPQCEKN